MKKTILFLFLCWLVLYVTAQSQLKVTTANVHLRSSASIESNSICIIPVKTLLNVDYENQGSEEWIKIDYKGKTGYVYVKYLQTPASENTYSISQDNKQNDSTSSKKYYINSKGEKIQSPTHYKSPPDGASAECQDGTYSFSTNRRGTCSHHGGVKKWL